MSKKKNKEIRLAKGDPQNVSNATTAIDKGRKRASNTIKKQFKREVSWQISDIKMALIMAENPINPDRLGLHQIYRYVLRDARLSSQVRDALLKIKSEPWMLYNGSEEKPDEKLSELFRSRWFNNIIQYIAEKEMHGYSVIELDKIDPENNTVGIVNLIPREHISIENQWVLINATVNGSYLPYGDIMWQIDLLEFADNRDDYGILLQCAYNVIWKYYARADWSRSSERWGSPTLAVTVDTNSDTELDEYETRAQNFGSDGYIIGQKGDEINILERSGTNMHLIWLDSIKFCNEEMTIMVNGQTATTDQKAFVGSSEVQERKFEDLTLSRLQSIVDDINEKVLPYLRYKDFKIAEDIRFDYPSLVRNRQEKLNGKQDDAATQTPTTDPKKGKAKQPTKDVKESKVSGNEQ